MKKIIGLPEPGYNRLCGLPALLHKFQTGTIIYWLYIDFLIKCKVMASENEHQLLINQLRQDNQLAFTQLYDLYSHRLYRNILR
ncbi:hypothetical protein, partial [Mucilaginibacter pankratovii]|uniref:hypothetical protein n=1 Tax=Mucilaginibacter pankratovii TaxID=2772110 RepID=UPI001CD15272